MSDDNVILFPTRDIVRSRRKRAVRAHTINMRRITKRELQLGAWEAEGVDVDAARPKTRGECESGPRPCPFVGCTHHLYLDVSSKTGAIKLNFPDIGPEEMEHSCALDIADRGGLTLESLGEVMNFTRERTRQIETKILDKLKDQPETDLLEDFIEGMGDAPGQRVSGGDAVPLKPVDHFAERDEGVTSPDVEPGDDRWSLMSNRAARAYENRLIARGFAQSTGQRLPNATERIAQIEENIRMTENVRDKVVAAYKDLEATLGRIPKAREIHDAIGGDATTTLGTIHTSTSNARKLGLLPARVFGTPNPKEPRPTTAIVRASKPDVVTGSWDAVLLRTLQDELGRIERRRTKVTELIAELESA